MTRPVQSEAPAKQGDRMGTHSASCWSFGPRHYECALNEIERLAALQAAPADPVAGVGEAVAFIQARAALKGLVALGDEHEVDGIIDDCVATLAPSPSVERLVGALRQVRSGLTPAVKFATIHRIIDEALAQAKGNV